MNSRKKLYDELAGAICRFIDEHYREDITIDILKCHLHTSRSTIYRIFRTKLKTKPRFLLNAVRMYKTIASVHTRDKKTLVETALYHGFSDENLVEHWCKKLLKVNLDKRAEVNMTIRFDEHAKPGFARAIANYLKYLDLGK